jgi:hypothetical protein
MQRCNECVFSKSLNQKYPRECINCGNPNEIEQREAEEKKLNEVDDEPMLQFFNYDHLPPHLSAVSAPFSFLAYNLVVGLPRSPERTASLRKLLEAKDCAVRALIYKQ